MILLHLHGHQPGRRRIFLRMILLLLLRIVRGPGGHAGNDLFLLRLRRVRGVIKCKSVWV